MALADNIVAYWNLNDDGSGEVSLVDSTGNGNTLTNSNGVTLGTGIIDGDASFNGSVGPLLTSSPVLSSGGSLSFWCKISTGSWQTPISQWQSAGWKFGYSDAQDILYFYTGSAYYFNATNVADGNWHNVVVTDDGSGNLSFYFDGLLDGTSSLGLINFSYILSIGADVNGNEKIIGGVDEVGVWSRELTASEVTSLYNAGSAITYPFAPVFYYNAAVNNSFGTLGNYWLDSSFTTPATSLPTSNDFVVITGNASSGSLVCVSAMINNSAISGSASITGAVVLNGTSSISSSVTITGNAVLNGTSTNSGTITGSATLNGASTNSGTITGSATLNGASTNSGTIGGNATFNDSSSNEGSITGGATFNDSSSNTGDIGGNAGVYHPAENPLGGTVDGTITYYWPFGTGLWGNEVWINGSASFIIPAESDVKAGVEYGPAESPYIGTYTGSGGGGGDATIARLLNLPWFIKL